MPLFLLTVLSSSTVFSADTTPRSTDKQYGSVNVTEDSTLKKLLTVPGVDLKYIDCKKRYPINNGEVPKCVWDEISPDQKKKVQEIYAQEAEASTKSNSPSSPSRTPANEDSSGKSVLSTGLTARKMNIGIDYKTDPAMKVLSDFFGKKLEEILKGSEQDKKDKKIMTIDQSKFIELYKSELGKSIVNSLTSYCINTPESCRTSGTLKCIIPKDPDKQKINRDINLKFLNESANFSEEEGKGWSKCILDVSKVCYDIKVNEDPKPGADEIYSNTQACLIIDFIKTSRKNIIAAEEQEKFYKELQSKPTIGIQITNIKVVDEKELTSDKVTQLNSSDLAKDFKDSNDKTVSVSKTLEQTEKEAKECDKKLANDERCNKFLNTNTEKNTDAVTAFGLGQMAQEKNLEEKLTKEENVANYLKEEGYEDGQIKEMLKKENIEGVKAKITERFKNENAAIIREMADRVAKKTSNKDGVIDNNDSSKMDTIKKELATRNQDLKELIHFNNIVSSYLSISTGKDDKNGAKDGNSNKKETSRNTASLMAEVESMDAKESKDLKERIKSNKDLKGSEHSTSVSVSTINQILNYITLKENPKD